MRIDGDDDLCAIAWHGRQPNKVQRLDDMFAIGVSCRCQVLGDVVCPFLPESVVRYASDDKLFDKCSVGGGIMGY